MIEKMVWTEEIAVNIAEIDEQHQVLFGIINDLIKLHEKKAGTNEVLEIIGRLVDYSNRHFITEDNLMIDHEFPLFVQHNNEHLNYMKHMDTFINDFSQGRIGISEEILTFLTKWWFEHVAKSDIKYSRHIHAMKTD